EQAGLGANDLLILGHRCLLESPWRGLRNPDPMWTAPWQALSSATSLWRLRSYVRPVDASSQRSFFRLGDASAGVGESPAPVDAGEAAASRRQADRCACGATLLLHIVVIRSHSGGGHDPGVRV